MLGGKSVEIHTHELLNTPLEAVRATGTIFEADSWPSLLADVWTAPYVWSPNGIYLCVDPKKREQVVALTRAPSSPGREAFDALRTNQ